MSTEVGFPVSCRWLPPARRLTVARLEKPSPANGMDSGTASADSRREGSDVSRGRSPASRTGTGAAQRRTMTRHSAPFAAQIIGQVLGGARPDANIARAAYARASIPPGRGMRLDRRA